MVNPVPGFRVTTPFGIRGRHWSCQRDASGHGIHTGADWAAPAGTTVVAARPGVARWVNYGAAFGSWQLAVQNPDGTADFYAHMTSRAANGTTVRAGQRIGTVGASGNATGPHLHFERHRTHAGWSCTNITNPQPSIDWEEDWLAMATEAQVRAIVRAEIQRAIPDVATRVNGVLGDFDAQGQPRSGVTNPERGNVRLRRILNRL